MVSYGSLAGRSAGIDGAPTPGSVIGPSPISAMLMRPDDNSSSIRRNNGARLAELGAYTAVRVLAD
jgi:hypothetical protein